MREIKFRVWDKNRKQMYYPLALRWDVFYGEESKKLLLSPYMEKGRLRGQLNPVITLEEGEEIKSFQDNIILLQYTGLKDKNGKEIYEGDIVLIKTEEWDSEKEKECWKREIVHIKIHNLANTKAYFDLECLRKWDNNYTYEDWSDDWEFEDNIQVIGNIYENPELLKEDKK